MANPSKECALSIALLAPLSCSCSRFFCLVPNVWLRCSVENLFLLLRAFGYKCRRCWSLLLMLLMLFVVNVRSFGCSYVLLIIHCGIASFFAHFATTVSSWIACVKQSLIGRWTEDFINVNNSSFCWIPMGGMILESLNIEGGETMSLGLKVNYKSAREWSTDTNPSLIF